ncbi:MAG: ABC transporter ATP-binding protein [Actinomycetes bacterium]
MTLDASLHVTRGDFRLALDLQVAPGEVVALLGPNGAGKSTSLRAMAGLVELDDGHVRIDGEMVEDPARDLRVPTDRRPVGVVFQDYLLFPHLSARENVAFGLRARGVDRRAARARADAWLARVGLADQAAARPRELSGGQAQRVALARALVVEPRLLLLDEPLAALDAGTRLDVRSDLRRHLGDYDGATVLVTHDALDAMVLADRLVVIEAGRVVQTGPPTEVARRPRTQYVARLVGLNLYRGTAAGGRVQLEGGASLTTAEHPDGPVFVAFAPSAVALYRTHPEGSPRNSWQVRVAALEQLGDTVRVSLDGVGGRSLDVAADITAGAVAELDLAPGTLAWASVKATETQVYRA